MITIDPLSVATQGYFELNDTGNLDRNALRLVTLGWIIIDFARVPNTEAHTTLSFDNALSSFECSYEWTSFDNESSLSEANIVWEFASYENDYSFVDSFIESSETGMTLVATNSANIETSNSNLLSNNKTSLAIPPDGLIASVDPTQTE